MSYKREKNPLFYCNVLNYYAQVCIIINIIRLDGVSLHLSLAKLSNNKKAICPENRVNPENGGSSYEGWCSWGHGVCRTGIGPFIKTP